MRHLAYDDDMLGQGWVKPASYKNTGADHNKSAKKVKKTAAFQVMRLTYERLAAARHARVLTICGLLSKRVFRKTEAFLQNHHSIHATRRASPSKIRPNSLFLKIKKILRNVRHPGENSLKVLDEIE